MSVLDKFYAFSPELLEKKSYPTQDRNSSSACVLESKGPRQTSNLHSSLGRGTRKGFQDPQSAFRVLTGVSSLNRGKTAGRTGGMHQQAVQSLREVWLTILSDLAL